MATEKVQLSTWLPVDEANRVREAAEQEDRTVSQFIARALRVQLDAAVEPSEAVA